jgi:hypothetical protein
LQEQEKKAKEAELKQNLIEGSSTRMGNTRSDFVLNGVSMQVPTTEIRYNLRDGAPFETTAQQGELQVARESLAATRKRCEDLDRALNQV